MKEILNVKDLYVTYKGDGNKVHAVNGLSFSVDEGGCLGLVGETGAGKTTVALSIMGLLPNRTAKVESGEIVFDGNNLLELKEKEMQKIRGGKISMIFQDPMTSLNPVLPVGEQILEGLQLHNENQESTETLVKRAHDMLELVGIPSSRYEEYPHQFSGGMKQRVVIAMALACNPDLLIADEPTTALDVTIQAQVLDMIRDLRERLNMTLIMITHDLGIVAENCDTVGTVYAGEIIEYGTVEDIFDSDDHHPYTEGLFAALPNITRDEKRLKSIPGLMPDPTALPSGCSFNPRCSMCMDICKSEEPKIVKLNDSHYIKCHLFSDRTLNSEISEGEQSDLPSEEAAI